MNFMISQMPNKIVSSNPRKTHNDIRPPHPPWVPIVGDKSMKATLSFYYSDPLSKTPIRDVSHKNDPKADPNLETKTFGLFSTCDRAMRTTIVKQGIKLHFFCTRRHGTHGGVRVLTGYYRYGWYTEAPPSRKKTSVARDDFALAAERIRFVSPGFPLSDLTEYLHGFQLEPFRTFRYIDEKTAALLLLLLDQTPDAAKQYLAEIARVEDLVKKERKMLYTNRSTGFSWHLVHAKSDGSLSVR